MINNNIINTFENETGLKIRKQYNGTYNEITGKSFKTIIEKITNFNKVHNTNIKCYNDYNRDVTIITI